MSRFINNTVIFFKNNQYENHNELSTTVLCFDKNYKADLMILEPSLIVIWALLTSGKKPSNRLNEEFSWNEIDYEFLTEQDRKTALDSGLFVRGAGVPSSLEVWADKIFLAIPRLRPGVPSTLNYISLTDVNTKSPELVPYPSWDMNQNVNKSSKQMKMTSVYSVRADCCGRLWALDTGVTEELEARKVETPPMIFVFNLNDNTLIRKYTLQEGEFSSKSQFRNIAVDATSGDCESAFAYLADSTGSLIVYSWLMNKSHRITNNYFYFNPIWGNFRTSTGKDVQLNEGIFGMALSLANRNGFRDLLFHPMIGVHEFKVSTEVLLNRSLAETNVTKFYVLGDRGANSQSAASYLDLESGIFFYTTIAKNGVSCWNYFKGEEFLHENQGTVGTFQEHKAFPYDLKVDKNGTLWVLTNRMLDFIYDEKTIEHSSPFQIYSGVVRNIIKTTPCEPL